MQFIQVDITVNPDFYEILLAEFSELGFDSFWEKDDSSFIAYIDSEIFNEQILKDVKLKYPDAEIMYQYEGLESKNWNEEWEKNFQPILIADKCFIRSTFHEPKPEVELEIIIEPKMAFGTGHHATTSMMVEQMLSLDMKGKKVMDVGTGSGILAICASKLGCENVFAFDIDDWSVENTIENLQLNHINNVEIKKGTIKDFASGLQFDIILANITRNILLEELTFYAKQLKKDGFLLISGFYNEDIELFALPAVNNDLTPERTLMRDNWACVQLRKIK